jgi:hypothetical protein
MGPTFIVSCFLLGLRYWIRSVDFLSAEAREIVVREENVKLEARVVELEGAVAKRAKVGAPLTGNVR